MVSDCTPSVTHRGGQRMCGLTLGGLLRNRGRGCCLVLLLALNDHVGLCGSLPSWGFIFVIRAIEIWCFAVVQLDFSPLGQEPQSLHLVSSAEGQALGWCCHIHGRKAVTHQVCKCQQSQTGEGASLWKQVGWQAGAGSGDLVRACLCSQGNFTSRSLCFLICKRG